MVHVKNTKENIGNKIRNENIIKNFKNEVDKLIDEVKNSNDKCQFYCSVRNIKEIVDELINLNPILDDLIKTIEKQYQSNFDKKKNIIKEAQELSNSTDWNTATERIKELTEQWNKIGYVKKEKAQLIWDEFDGYRKKFFENKKAFFQNLKTNQSINVQHKLSIIREVEGLSFTEDWTNSKRKIKELTDEFYKIGYAGKEENPKLDSALRAAKNQFYTKCNEYFYNMNSEKFDELNNKKNNLLSYKVKLEDQIYNLESQIADINTKLIDVLYRTDIHGCQRRWNLEKAISDREERIYEKRDKLQEVEGRILRLEASAEVILGRMRNSF